MYRLGALMWRRPFLWATGTSGESANPGVAAADVVGAGEVVVFRVGSGSSGAGAVVAEVGVVVRAAGAVSSSLARNWFM